MVSTKQQKVRLELWCCYILTKHRKCVSFFRTNHVQFSLKTILISNLNFSHLLALVEEVL